MNHNYLNEQFVLDLKRQFGEAFYLLDSNSFRKNYIELKDAFSSLYSNFNIAYSYKTNYIPKLCKIVNELGGFAEVVSEMELELATKIGVDYSKIIWNGPIKEKRHLKTLLLNGGIVNLDSLDDLKLVLPIVSENPSCSFNIGVRVNFEVGDGVVSRFGFDSEGEDFNECVSFLKNTKNVVFASIQCHFAKRNIEYWSARANGMIEVIKKIGIVPKIIDLGGGIYGKMPNCLRVQLGVVPCDYLSYASIAAKAIKSAFSNCSPILVVEPGTALVGDCVKFVGTIKTIKQVRGKWFATVLASQKNISMSGINPPIDIVHTGGESSFFKDIDFVGYTCIESDVIYKNYSGSLSLNDTIIINNCGSYSLVMKPPFILPNFPVIDYDGKNIEIIKRGETFDDIFETYIF